MSVRVAMLGSGSQGNATVIVGEETRILVDAGFSARQMALRLEQIGLDPTSVDAIVVTHDHGDHTRGVGVFARKFGTPVYVTSPTQAACEKIFLGAEEVRSYEAGRPFSIGEFRIEPFLTVHDAADPVAITLHRAACGTRVGIATDLGRPTAGIRHSLSGCDFLILEANHDEQLLRSGPYPPSVQARIASSHGHLSNRAAAEFVRELLHPRLTGVLLAHLSAECNRPELALAVVGEVLREEGYQGYLEVAQQDHPTPLLSIEALRSRHGPLQGTLL
jgi:phosphoribosyl 1,2-cyclic phosphodiesterase